MVFLYSMMAIAAGALVLLLIMTKGSARIGRTLSLSLFISVIGASAFILEFPKSTHIARAVTSIKQWVQSPIEQTNTMVDDYIEIPVIKIQEKVLIDVPLLSQLPELPRGCEVTSLAMLLNSAGIEVDKMTLAQKVKKDTTPYTTTNGQVSFGNPHTGFVGDMYTKDKPGLGVYHEPISMLANQYLPNKVKDITGSEFQDLKIHLSDNRPVWVIINSQYEKLPQDQFQTWNTPIGKIQVTYREHSVVITGYDQNYIYFNDPLTATKNKKAPIKDFEEAWVQMGRQAITYLP